MAHPSSSPQPPRSPRLLVSVRLSPPRVVPLPPESPEAAQTPFRTVPRASAGGMSASDAAMSRAQPSSASRSKKLSPSVGSGACGEEESTPSCRVLSCKLRATRLHLVRRKMRAVGRHGDASRCGARGRRCSSEKTGRWRAYETRCPDASLPKPAPTPERVRRAPRPRSRAGERTLKGRAACGRGRGGAGASRRLQPLVVLQASRPVKFIRIRIR